MHSHTNRAKKNIAKSKLFIIDGGHKKHFKQHKTTINYLIKTKKLGGK